MRPHLLFILFLAGCAAVPEAIRTPLPENPALAEVSRNPLAFKGRRARWGGVILRKAPHRTQTWVEVEGMPLDEEGHPQGKPRGRFWLQVKDAFLDPSVFVEGWKVTALGILQGMGTPRPGLPPHPVLEAEVFHVWKPRFGFDESYSDAYWHGPACSFGPLCF